MSFGVSGIDPRHAAPTAAATTRRLEHDAEIAIESFSPGSTRENSSTSAAATNAWP